MNDELTWIMSESAVKEADAAQREFFRAKRDGDLVKMGNITAEKTELLAMNRYANMLGKVVSIKRDMQDALKADQTKSVKEKRLELKVMEKEEEELYDNFLDEFKMQKKIMRARNN